MKSFGSAVTFEKKIELGKTGIRVSRIGIGSSYGINTSSLEEAFERGINYFYFGTLRKAAMAHAVQNIARKGHRAELHVAIQSYASWPLVVRKSVDMALRKLRVDYADFLILGKFDRA